MTDRHHAQLTSRTGGHATFDGIRVDGRIAGLLLDVSTVQTFNNRGVRHLELVYTFPLPANAVLLSMTVRLGERLLTGSVVEKRAAAARYEDMLADGDSAIMLERTADGSYCLNIGNLAPGETGEITLRYAQALRFDGDGLRVCIPTVIAPRFGDPVRDAGLDPHQVTAHNLHAAYPFALSLQLAPEFSGATVASPSHPIAVSAGRVVLHGDATLDRDFVLTLTGFDHSSGAIAAADPVTPGQSAVLAGFRPSFTDAAPRPVRVKILVDCSGSMAGDSIAAARKALQAVLADFRGDDRFSLSRFGTTVEHRNHLLWKPTPVTRIRAARWIGHLEADMGGTDMGDALASTFALDDATPSDVLLVTDGHIHAIDSVNDAARTKGHRLFIVAIGSATSEEHLRRLARATGGAVDFLAPGEPVAPAIRRMFARLRSPRLDRLRLAWSSGRTVRWALLPEVVFSGDTVHVYALIDDAAADGDTLTLFGRASDGAEHTIGVATMHAAPDDGALARMAIHAQLDDSPAQNAQLACTYGLVTRHTNFLLTLERAAHEKAHAMPHLQHIDQMVPAGWAGTGSVRHFRQPAVFRREGVSEAMHMARNGVENYDIPAFLRKYDDGYLTPLALHTLLATTLPAAWDVSYADLLASGIDPAVVQWLQNSVDTHLPERQVVASFLACMACADMQRTLAGAASASAPWWARRRTPACPPMPPTADAQLVARIAAALAGITALEWPPAVRLRHAETATTS